MLVRANSGNPAGLAVDVVMYVTSDATSCSGNVAAFAIPCLYDWDTNRPIVGMLNLCQLALTNYSPDKLLATTIHEITHALVSLGVQNRVSYLPAGSCGRG